MVDLTHFEEDSGSGSESDSNEGSRSPTPGNAGPSENEEGNRSGSQSPASRTSRSRSRSTGNRSRSHLVNAENDAASHKSRSRSGTPLSHRSGSGSRKSGSRSRSGSQHTNRSGSAASNRSRSRSGSARSRSGTPHSARSGSGSRKSKSKSKSVSRSRSRSQSKASGRGSRSGSESGSDIGKDKRKRAVLSDSGSESGKVETKKPKSALIDTDSEEEVAGEQVDATELFGDADDISTDEEAHRAGKDGGRDSEDDVRRGTDHDDSDRRSDRRSSGSDRGRSDDEKEKEPEPEPEPIPERRIDVEIPRIVTDLGRDIHFVKLPNFLSVDTRPFDPDTYEDEIDEEETLDEEGRQRIKLKVTNTIRWRDYMDDCGNMVKESNARMVKWSDGSMSLHLGNEIFDVYKQPLQGDHNHLFIRQGTGLQGQAVFRTKLTFRPHSTESFTHKKMTMSLADRSQKTPGIKILTQVGHDPDADRRANLKKEEEKLRQAIRQKSTQNKPKRNRDLAASHGSAYREYGEHDSDDEGAISIAAIKNKYNKNTVGKQGAAIYSSDDDDSDLDSRRNKKTDKSKALRALVDSDEDSASGSNKGGNASNDEAEDGNISAD